MNLGTIPPIFFPSHSEICAIPLLFAKNFAASSIDKLAKFLTPDQALPTFSPTAPVALQARPAKSLAPVETLLAMPLMLFHQPPPPPPA